MKKKIRKIAKKKSSDLEGKKINRTAAIKKTGYIALSAATMMILLASPARAQSVSPASPPDW